MSFFGYVCKHSPTERTDTGDIPAAGKGIIHTGIYIWADWGSCSLTAYRGKDKGEWL